MDSGSSENNEKLILLCIDASKHSAHALKWFHKYFYREEHVIGLLQIYTKPDTPTFDPDNAVYRREVREEIKKSSNVTETFQDACNKRGMVSKVIVEQKIDSIGETICRVAKESGASCIVMGQRGMGTIKRAVFGSTSDYVLHHARVTVLVVPPPKEDKDYSFSLF